MWLLALGGLERRGGRMLREQLKVTYPPGGVDIYPGTLLTPARSEVWIVSAGRTLAIYPSKDRDLRQLCRAHAQWAGVALLDCFAPARRYTAVVLRRVAAGDR